MTWHADSAHVSRLTVDRAAAAKTISVRRTSAPVPRRQGSQRISPRLCSWGSGLPAWQSVAGTTQSAGSAMHAALLTAVEAKCLAERVWDAAVADCAVEDAGRDGLAHHIQAGLAEEPAQGGRRAGARKMSCREGLGRKEGRVVCATGSCLGVPLCPAGAPLGCRAFHGQSGPQRTTGWRQSLPARCAAPRSPALGEQEAGSVSLCVIKAALPLQELGSSCAANSLLPPPLPDRTARPLSVSSLTQTWPPSSQSGQLRALTALGAAATAQRARSSADAADSLRSAMS